MTYEVELKFPLDETDRILTLLEELGAQPGDAVVQRDRYFAHPVRDFAETDEALRIRCAQGRGCITYKGPKVDARTKTRHEIEIPVGSDLADAERLAEILAVLGFREVRTVEKTRVTYPLSWEGRTLAVAYDKVDGLGTFLEIEALAEESDRDQVRDSVLRCARRLGLENDERRSYLALLLEKASR